MEAYGRLELSWDIQNLFRHHAKGMARFLHRRGINQETAVDLTQDTFLRVIATPPRDGMQNNNPKAYLYQAARNLGINHQKREALIEITSLDDEDAVKLADPAPSAERIVCSKQCLVQTYQALSELPERTRLAFEMHRLGERTIAEVAEELGISTTRAWTLIRDAYRHLVGRVDLF
ncbi:MULTISPECIES: sigma-70 family RNA polymerase sigma factor [Brucella]|uniref:sigma-70 family RNA polymerase sigma factor n=1 Tax=Brucella TaxID=234 RepID=UPI000AD2260C|nr:MULTISPECIES: sigma-70 family RNA polymerase sigma factor [Brucella]